MATTKAYTVPTMKGERTVMVMCASGWVDWPIMYNDGSVAYDAPERVPQYIRPIVAKLFREIRGN
jgi:hypothetical protein